MHSQNGARHFLWVRCCSGRTVYWQYPREKCLAYIRHSVAENTASSFHLSLQSTLWPTCLKKLGNHDPRSRFSWVYLIYSNSLFLINCFHLNFIPRIVFLIFFYNIFFFSIDKWMYCTYIVDFSKLWRGYPFCASEKCCYCELFLKMLMASGSPLHREVEPFFMKVSPLPSEPINGSTQVGCCLQDQAQNTHLLLNELCQDYLAVIVPSI